MDSINENFTAGSFDGDNNETPSIASSLDVEVGNSVRRVSDSSNDAPAEPEVRNDGDGDGDVHELIMLCHLTVLG